MAESTPRRGSGAGPPPGRLSETTIVAAALEIVQACGVTGLTMRRLAERLGVSVAAAYKHVANREALLQLCAVALFARVEEADAADADWIARLRALMVDFYDVLSAYPGMSAYLALDPAEFPRRAMAATMRDILLGAGFSDEEAWDVLTTFVFYASGALDGPMSRLPLGADGADLLRGAYGRGLDRLLDGLSVARARRGD